PSASELVASHLSQLPRPTSSFFFASRRPASIRWRTLSTTDARALRYSSPMATASGSEERGTSERDMAPPGLLLGPPIGADAEVTVFLSGIPATATDAAGTPNLPFSVTFVCLWERVASNNQSG